MHSRMSDSNFELLTSRCAASRMGFVGEKTPNDQYSMCGGFEAGAAVDGPAVALSSTSFPLAVGFLKAKRPALLDDATPPFIEPRRSTVALQCSGRARVCDHPRCVASAAARHTRCADSGAARKKRRNFGLDRCRGESSQLTVNLCAIALLLANLYCLSTMPNEQEKGRKTRGSLPFPRPF